MSKGIFAPLLEAFLRLRPLIRFGSDTRRGFNLRPRSRIRQELTFRPGNRLGPILLCAVWLLTCAGAAVAGPPRGEECTIAVLSGRATKDGRPILWKNRDAEHLENEVLAFDDGTYRYVALVTAGFKDHAWIGVNERGFAILNALSKNLPDSLPGGRTNGGLMKEALKSCANVRDFERLLLRTNAEGRENPSNFAVIDASGKAMIFEAGAHSFVRFDADDPKAAPNGFLCRANFSFSGDTTGVDTWRARRCRRLLQEAVADGGADPEYLLDDVARDLTSIRLDPYPLPYPGEPFGAPQVRARNAETLGHVDASETISRRWSVAGGAVQGVLSDEDPRLSTFFAVVSHPLVTVPIPVWVAAGATPSVLGGHGNSPLCYVALERMRALYDLPGRPDLLNTRLLVNEQGTGFLNRVQAIEGWLYPETERWLRRWRAGRILPREMAKVEARLAEDAFTQYRTGTPPASRLDDRP